MVDVERASVEAAESIQIRNKDEILAAVADIAERLSANVEVTGSITRVEEEAVYTSLGQAAGVIPEEILSVIQVDLIRDDKGIIIMREENPIANLKVEKVSPEGSRCRVLESAAKLETGFSVRKGRVDIERKETEASLVVKSVPENARVYLNSEFSGVTL
ncbi:MAG: hypothetical protein KAT35_04545 [Candidatus Aenigmarchaeota archaeon]|nr:hypothetical protein [Candidatus Aenigmarchaeota archaeon]